MGWVERCRVLNLQAGHILRRDFLAAFFLPAFFAAFFFAFLAMMKLLGLRAER